MLDKDQSSNSNRNGEWMPSDLITAVENGDLPKVKSLLHEDPSCIKDKNELLQNALQVAIITLHEDIANFLLDNTDISVRHRDSLGRDSLDLVLIGGSERLSERINDRWHTEAPIELGASKLDLDDGP